MVVPRISKTCVVLIRRMGLYAQHQLFGVLLILHCNSPRAKCASGCLSLVHIRLDMILAHCVFPTWSHPSDPHVVFVVEVP
ncbi:hypothetical protein BJ138DRAFT_1165337 [Hygrophoropsis aurantiaca]|uniref:Uncharacterized protein n=1 Tax=Hygrophoropsis aurantiaca TaxID=72124 RepID=A0ACB7ZVD1_9AGAM|nr:hypothetical protein BJ138DRAFT_1165337 [Hygrophoropsis aurantiaca]